MASRLLKKMYLMMLNVLLMSIILNYSYLLVGTLPKNLKYAFILLFIISLIPSLYVYLASIPMLIQIIHLLIKDSIGIPPQISLMIYLFLYFNIMSRIAIESS